MGQRKYAFYGLKLYTLYKTCFEFLAQNVFLLRSFGKLWYSSNYNYMPCTNLPWKILQGIDPNVCNLNSLRILW